MPESYVTTLLFTMLNTTVYLDNCVFFLGLLAPPATEEDLFLLMGGMVLLAEYLEHCASSSMALLKPAHK